MTQTSDEIVYTAAEREEILGRMRAVLSNFYYGAQRTGCHTFIEWTGVMQKYYDICRHEHDAGRDFTNSSVHTGGGLGYSPEWRDHDFAYLAEKLTCIFGTDEAFWARLMTEIKHR